MPSKSECEKLQAPNGLPICEDYLLDIESGESITKLDHGSSKGLQSLGYGSLTQADRPGYSSTLQKSDPLVLANRLHDCLTDLDTNDFDSNVIFSCTAGCEISIEDRWYKYPTSFSVENIDKLEDVSSMFSERNDEDIIFNPDLTSGGMFCPLTTKQENEHSSVGENVNRESHLGLDVLRTSPKQASSVGSRAEKRLRKPPQRYIDELLEPNSRCMSRRSEVRTPIPKDKNPRVKSHRHSDVKSGAERSSPEDSAGKAIQVPFGPLVCTESQKSQAERVIQVPFSPLVCTESQKSHAEKDSRKRQAKKESRKRQTRKEIQEQKAIAAKVKIEPNHHLVSSPKLKSSQEVVPYCRQALHSEEVASAASSIDDSVGMLKSGENNGRRKHHILWSVSEVRKLIDGVSRYGVGRWSRIKKDLFSSSAHRTPVDLKDKWRNLLKATYVQRETKRGEDRKRTLAWRPLPKSILRRVSELAVIYPYPRDLRSKH